MATAAAASAASPNAQETQAVVEQQLLPVPDEARTSTTGNQFWIWAGANIAPINWVLGALGATLATASQTVDPGELVVRSYGTLAIPVILLVIHGPIATNVLNVYSCSLCAQTVDWKVDRRRLCYGVGVLAAVFTVFLIYREDFAETLDGWLASMVTWVAPWAVIALVHFYGFARQRVDVGALFDEPGSSRIADVRWSAVIAFLAGIVATWAFSFGVPTFLQGPGAKALGNVDLSWLAGALVAGLVYWFFGRPHRAGTSSPAARSGA